MNLILPVLLLLSIATSGLALPKIEVRWHRHLPSRYLAFPNDKWTTAEVYLMSLDVRGKQRIFKSAFKDLGPARGKVYVPRGGAAGLVITMEGAEQLASLSKLKPDDIQYIRARSIPLRASDLKELLHLTGLQQFDTEFTDVDDSSLEVLSKFKNMETLKIGSCNVTDAHLELINEMPNLKNLFLEYMQITDNGIKKLAGNKSLVTLGLEGCKLTSKCIPYLLTIKNLEHLRIPGASLTEKDLMKLAKKKTLKHLQVGFHTKLNAIAKFRKERPDCAVSRYKIRIPIDMLF